VFKVIDVSNPLSPSELGSVPHGFSDLRIEPQVFHNDIVWCIRSSSGGTGQATHVFGVDVSDPSSPVLRGTVQLQSTSSLLSRYSLIYAGYWLVHDYSRSLIYVIDISDPDAPTVFSSWSVPNMVNGGPGTMMVDGTLLYLPCGENFTLRIYDLSDLSAVTQVGSVSTGNEQLFGNAVKIGSLVYVDTNIYLGASFLTIFDVSDPTQPTIVGSGPSVGVLMGRNGKLFAFSGGNTVSAISLLDPLQPVVENTVTIPIPAPSTSLELSPLSTPLANWVGGYLIGMTGGSASQYSGVRALNFYVN